MNTTSRFADIPLPDRRTDVTIREQSRLWPNHPGYTTGVVHADESGRTTVQCAVCLRTATGSYPGAPIIHAGWNFTSDTAPGEDWPEPGHTPYRRCSDCRRQRLHPQH